MLASACFSAARVIKIAKTKATTIPPFTSNSIIPRSKSSGDLPILRVKEDPTDKMCRTEAITPMIRNLLSW
jgi:hypothetical protein